MLDKKRLRTWIYTIFGLLAVLCIPFWLLFLAPYFEKFPNHFFYSADILSLDNFYDESAKKFQGEHISKTLFSYKTTAHQKQYMTIENKFAVRTLNNKPIISVTREYFIDPHTGQLLSKNLSYLPNTYLFGPRYAQKKGYFNWHINYDVPAPLTFVGEEKIDGLTVYHYKAHYLADQTVHLSYLPLVPEKRAVKTDVLLQLWIEPISGWLIKYQDNTQAFYYDIKTGARIAPWNKFSNRYTHYSVHEQVKNAKKLKWRILFFDFGLPSFLCIIAVFCFWSAFAPTKKISMLKRLKHFFILRKKSYYLTFTVCTLFILISCTLYYFFYKKVSPKYSIGISQWAPSSEEVNIIQGFKQGLAKYGFIAGKNVHFILSNAKMSIKRQISIIQSFTDDKVNLIFTLSTPSTLVAMGISHKIPIVFSNVRYPIESEIIYSSQNSKNNLVGIRNYIAPAKLIYTFEKIFPDIKSLGFIRHKGDPDSETQFNEFKALLSARNIPLVDIAAIDLEQLKQLLVQKHAFNALFLACDRLSEEGGSQLVAAFSKKNKIPSFGCDKKAAFDGLLMVIAADPFTIGLLAGQKAAFILQGAFPEWLHTETLNQSYMVINLDSARYLNLSIQPELLKQADYLIQGQK